MLRLLLGALVALLLPALAHADRVAFNRDVRPILSDKCFSCHGPDAGHRKAGLRLDTADGARAALEPGKPHDSELFRRVTSKEPRGRMPPAKSGKALSPSEIAILRQWIEEGAAYEQHWSYARMSPSSR
jgi:mono/diheme cytochrome c family protein